MKPDDAIRMRCTEKVLAKTPLPTSDRRQQIDEIVALAGMAPFHRACEEHHRGSVMNGIEPWRFRMLDAKACRRLIDKLPSENAGKIPAMLAGRRCTRPSYLAAEQGHYAGRHDWGRHDWGRHD